MSQSTAVAVGTGVAVRPDAPRRRGPWRLGDAVVASNMEVMTKGFELVREIKVGELEAPDRSTLRGKALLPVVGGNGDGAGCGSGCRSHARRRLSCRRQCPEWVESNIR